MAGHSVISRSFLAALKLHPEPAYRIAVRAGLHPSTLSQLITGALRPRERDARIIAVGKELGLPPDACFDTPAPIEVLP
jgi:hypothetical protein